MIYLNRGTDLVGDEGELQPLRFIVVHVDWEDGIIHSGIDGDEVEQRALELHRAAERDVVGMVGIGAAILVDEVPCLGIVLVLVWRVGRGLDAQRRALAAEDRGLVDSVVRVPDGDTLPVESHASGQLIAGDSIGVSLAELVHPREHDGAKLFVQVGHG